jgi:hypothetical protein
MDDAFLIHYVTLYVGIAVNSGRKDCERGRNLF